MGPEVATTADDTGWGASLGGGGDGSGGMDTGVGTAAAAGWGDALPAPDNPLSLGLDEDANSDEDEDAGNAGGATISRSGSGAWVNPLNTPTPRDASPSSGAPLSIAGQSDTLTKMGSILNSLATGGALPSGQTAQADDPFALAQAREAKKKRKASLSYKIRKQLFSPKFLRPYFILALAAQTTLGVLFFMIQQLLKEVQRKRILP
jgi:hypothetical protein